MQGDGANGRVDMFLKMYESFKNSFIDEVTKIRSTLVRNNQSALLTLISGSNNPLIDNFLKKYIPEGSFKEELNKAKEIFAPIEKYGIATKLFDKSNPNGYTDVFASTKKNLDENKQSETISTFDEEIDRIRKTLESEKDDVIDKLRKSLL